MDEQERLEQQITQIGDRYLRRTLGELPRLHELIASLGDAAVRASGSRPLADIQRLAHRIQGSGAMFGFDDISERARDVELLAESRADEENLGPRLKACAASLDEQVRAVARARGIE